MKAFFCALLVALAAALPSAAQALPDELSINDEAYERPRTAAGIRRELAQCLRARACRSVYLETCTMCIASAQAERGGYSIMIRTGQPGPEYDLYDRRRGRTAGRLFSAADMIAIFAAQVSGARLRYVGTIERPDETTQ